MDFKKFGNFSWIEIDSKDQNLNLTRKWIHFCLFQSIFVCWVRNHRIIGKGNILFGVDTRVDGNMR